MLNRNSKAPSQKENSHMEDSKQQILRNSSAVDMLVESMQNSTARKPFEPQQKYILAYPRQEDIFRLVSSHLNNSELESSQRSSHHPPLGPFKKQDEARQDRSFKKRDSKEEVQQVSQLKRSQVQSMMVQLQKKISGQLKKQQTGVEDLRHLMEQSFKRMIEQLNKKFVAMDKTLVEVNEQNMVTISTMELFKQVTAKQFEQVTARLDCQLQDRMEQSGYDLNLQAEQQQLLSKQFVEDLEKKHQAQLAEVFREIERVRQEVSRPTALQSSQPQPAAVQQASNQLKGYVDQSLRQRDKVSEPRLMEMERVLRIHDENLGKINHEFQRVINEHLNPRIFRLEELSRKPPASPIDEPTRKILEELQQFRGKFQGTEAMHLERLNSSKVVQLRQPNEFESGCLQKTKSITMNDCYFIDSEQYLLDCRGVYLTDDKNQRIKLLEDQLYFLQQQGIQIAPLG